MARLSCESYLYLFLQDLTTWGMFLWNKWVWPTRISLHSLGATPWFVLAIIFSFPRYIREKFYAGNFLHNYFPYHAGKMPQGTFWIWGTMDYKPSHLWQLLFQVRWCFYITTMPHLLLLSCNCVCPPDCGQGAAEWRERRASAVAIRQGSSFWPCLPATRREICCGL